MLLWKNRNDLYYNGNPNILYICGDLDIKEFGEIEWIDLRMPNKSWNVVSTYNDLTGYTPLSLHELLFKNKEVTKSFCMRNLVK